MELHILSGLYYVKSSFIFSYFGAEKWGRGVSKGEHTTRVCFLVTLDDALEVTTFPVQKIPFYTPTMATFTGR